MEKQVKSARSLLRCEALASMVQRCVLCGTTAIFQRRSGRSDLVTCGVCGAVFEVEFDPPDEPQLRARIELILAPTSKADPPE